MVESRLIKSIEGVRLIWVKGLDCTGLLTDLIDKSIDPAQYRDFKASASLFLAR